MNKETKVWTKEQAIDRAKELGMRIVENVDGKPDAIAIVGWGIFYDADDFKKRCGGKMCWFIKSFDKGDMRIKQENRYSDFYAEEAVSCMPKSYKLAKKYDVQAARAKLAELTYEYVGDGNKIKEFAAEQEELIKELGACSSREHVITYEGRFFSTIPKRTMSFMAEEDYHAVGVLLE